jgi:hypothetical protein
MIRRFDTLNTILGMFVCIFGSNAGVHPKALAQTVHAIWCVPTEYRAEQNEHDIRLGVLIGESCGSIAPKNREQVENIVGRDIPQTATGGHRGDSDSRLVCNLLLGQRGFVDFTSARAGEGASGSHIDGPDFTFCFHQAIVQRSAENLDWDQVFDITKAKLICKSNGKQVPVAMATPSIVSRNKALLEISLVRVGGRVQIKTVREGGKGAEAG